MLGQSYVIQPQQVILDQPAQTMVPLIPSQQQIVAPPEGASYLNQDNDLFHKPISNEKNGFNEEKVKRSGNKMGGNNENSGDYLKQRENVQYLSADYKINSNYNSGSNFIDDRNRQENNNFYYKDYKKSNINEDIEDEAEKMRANLFLLEQKVQKAISNSQTAINQGY